MAVTRNLMVRAGADFSAITKQAEKASASMKKMSTSISSSAGIIKKALGAIGIAVSLRAVVNAAKDAVNAYNEQAEAETKLAQAMRNTRGASADEVKEIKKLCAFIRYDALYIGGVYIPKSLSTLPIYNYGKSDVGGDIASSIVLYAVRTVVFFYNLDLNVAVADYVYVNVGVEILYVFRVYRACNRARNDT